MARILVVDDEELARFTIREILESAGHQVDEAGDGRQALDALAQVPFDLVVTDIIMPEKDGVSATIEIRQGYPDIKIIAVSGGGRTRNLDFLEMAKQYGADRILAKPFAEEELLEAVEGCLAEGA